MIVRKYQSTDCKEIADLFYETVHYVNAKDYSKEQLNAWASGNINLAEWNKSFLEHITVVAVENEMIVGFGDIDKDGYLDRLYVHKDYQNKGIATSICRWLETSVEADKIITHASITARSFFEHRGYQMIKEQQVERNNIILLNYIMEKPQDHLLQKEK